MHTPRRPARALLVLGLLVAGAVVFGLPSIAGAVESPHVPATTQTRSCSACHSTHGVLDAENDPAGLRSPCLRCHDVASPSSDPLAGHDVQVGGTMSCSACHSPHKTGPDARYVDPDDRTSLQSSPIRRIVDAQGAVYALVGSAYDGLAPTISAIVLDSSSDGTAPTITWTTSEAATSWVDWGTTVAYEYGSETTGTPFGTGDLLISHRVRLEGLVPGVTYHYRVRSADALGNVSTSADRTYTAFMTPPEEESVAPPVYDSSAQLIYADEFDGPLDTSVWQSRTPFNTQYVTGELQWYDPANLLFTNGNLRILTERRATNGYDYASGMITSLNKPKFTYGYFESRAKLPTGKGTWPAVWLTNDQTQEIDIMELLGERPTRMYMTYHRAGTQVYQQYFEGPDFSEGYHTFAMDWQADYIRWYVDGVLRAEYTGSIPSDPMWLIFNTAVGGAWAQDPDAFTPFPQTYDIDYVRVYDHKPSDVAAAEAAAVTAPNGYSVDTDSIRLQVGTQDTQRSVSAAAGWESAGPEALKPTPASPGTALTETALAEADTDDGEYLTTDIATTDHDWNWQLLKFDVGTSQLDALRSLNVLWNGHGEPTPGYPTALYLWESGEWRVVSSREMGVDSEASAERTSVSSEFCLTCHDEAAPAEIAPLEGLTDIRAVWAGDLHGSGTGDGFGAAQLKTPYARTGAVECSTCHDTHGTSNIYHFPAQVNGQQDIAVANGSEMRNLCSSCHEGALSDWHAPCVQCHRTGHWAGWVDPSPETLLPTENSDCTSCHGHGKSWTHPATCIRCHGLTELSALGAEPDAPWTYERTF